MGSVANGTRLPSDYLERVYAGVLGKLIGVYLGRPFEGWTHQYIMKKLGEIHYYVHERMNVPLVVTDDDVSGTFVFLRALSEHGATIDISAEDIGRSWLNNTIEQKSIFAWAGRGILTEHTAYLNLRHGIKAPRSGSVEVNGRTLAEQIGAQIFIDGWAMVAPANPTLAAKLAEAAGTVSHDGSSVHAAKLWAAMESEAFISKDIDHLLDVGLSQIPETSIISRLIGDIRNWAKIDNDWKVTRQRIEDNYGYDKWPGACHVVPNHGLMICALIYGGHDFHKAMHIVNTSGWDTDCNSGNLGCLIAIMHGLSSFEEGPDWRGPLADRAVISSADGGYSINNAARITYEVANFGRRLAGEPLLEPPKGGAQYHFSLPGSVQGFMVNPDSTVSENRVNIQQETDSQHRSGLSVCYKRLKDKDKDESVEILTDVFTPPNVNSMKFYQLMATPLLSPGQTVKAVIRSAERNNGSVSVALRLKIYNDADGLSILDGPTAQLDPDQEQVLTWKIQDVFDSQPIQKVGIAVKSTHGIIDGKVVLDSMSFYGEPHVTLKRPSTAQSHPFLPPPPDRPCTFWKRAWIDNLSTFATFRADSSFCLAHNEGEGICMTGTRDWANYQVHLPMSRIDLGSAGVAIRIQGVNRYYALVWKSDRSGIALVKAKDETRTELSSVGFEWSLDEHHQVTLRADQSTIVASVDGKKVLEAYDAEYQNGGMGIIVIDGCVSVDRFEISPC